MAYRTIVNNFTKGELDPRFLALVDYEGYHKGAREFKNVVCTPQGSATRRFGTLYSDVINDRNNANLPITNKDHVRMIDFEYNAEENYSIVIRPDSGDDGSGGNYVIAFDVYMGLTLVDTFYPPVDTYTVNQIIEFRWAKFDDRLILFHNDIIFHQLVREDFEDWEFKTTALSFFPTFDYTEEDDVAQPYTAEGETFTPTATSGTVTFARSAGTSTPFTDNHVGGLIFGADDGVMRITTINSATSVTGYTLSDFTNTNAQLGQRIFIAEKAWGDGSNNVVQGAARGWPGNGDFYQGRLYAGNWKSKAGRCSASTIRAFLNFDDSDSDALFGFSFFSGKGGNDVVNDVCAYKSLVVLGFNGASATSILTSEPATATNFSINLQSTDRCARIDSKIVDNQILFVDHNRESIYSMTYDIPDTGYMINDISALSAHLITKARWADVFNPIDKDGKYYCLINEDGTMPVLQVIQQENIRAWSDNFTNGRFIDVSCAGNEGHVLVQRQVNTGPNVAGLTSVIFNANRYFTVFNDVTDEIKDFDLVPCLRANYESLVFGAEAQFTRIDIGFISIASEDCELEFQYLVRGKWVPFNVTDGTLGFTQDGLISWDFDDVSYWTQAEVNGEERKYWMRIVRKRQDVTFQPIIDYLRVNLDERIYREELVFDVWMDCQFNVMSDDLGFVSGLERLAGHKAFIYVDDFPFGSLVIPHDGEIDLGVGNRNNKVMIGLDFKPDIVPMPCTALLQNGYNTYHQQHIVEAYIDYFESLGVTCNGQQVVLNDAGGILAVSEIEPRTGVYEVPIHRGWDPRQEIRISQSYPAPMTLLGIGLTVEMT